MKKLVAFSKTDKGFLRVTLADFIVRSAYQMGKTPLLPIFAAALGASDAFLGVIVAVSTFTGIVLKPAVGLLSDRWGRRGWLLVGTLFFSLTPFVYAFVDTPQQLFIVRIIHGLATAIYGPVTLAFVAEHSGGREAEKLGWFSTARSGGYIVGPVLAGVLLLSFSPATVFTLIGVVSSLAFFPVLNLPRVEVLKQPRRLSLSAQLKRAVKACGQSGPIWIAGGLESLNYIVLYALKTFLPLYALSSGVNIAVVGLFFSLQEAVVMLLKPFTGRLGDRHGYLIVIAAGMMVLGVTVYALTFFETAALVLLAAALSGAAQALIFPNSLALVATQADQTSLGLSMGLVGSLKNAGKVAGPLVAGGMMGRLDYALTFQLLAAGLVAVALGLFLLATQRQTRATILSRGTD